MNEVFDCCSVQHETPWRFITQVHNTLQFKSIYLLFLRYHNNFVCNSTALQSLRYVCCAQPLDWSCWLRVIWAVLPCRSSKITALGARRQLRTAGSCHRIVHCFGGATHWVLLEAAWHCGLFWGATHWVLLEAAWHCSFCSDIQSQHWKTALLLLTLVHQVAGVAVGFAASVWRSQSAAWGSSHLNVLFACSFCWNSRGKKLKKKLIPSDTMAFLSDANRTVCNRQT